MSTGQSAVMLCGWGVKAGMVHSTCGQTCGLQVKLCDPSLTRAIPERFRDEFLMIKCYIQIYGYFTYLRIYLTYFDASFLKDLVDAICISSVRA